MVAARFVTTMSSRPSEVLPVGHVDHLFGDDAGPGEFVLGDVAGAVADAVCDAARSSRMVVPLASGQLDLLAEAPRDRLPHPVRLPLFPAGATLLNAAMHAGALGTFISGAGPTVLALCADAAQVAGVARAFEATAQAMDVAGTTLPLGLTEQGAHVVA